MAGADAAPTAGTDGEGLTEPPQGGSPGVRGGLGNRGSARRGRLSQPRSSLLNASLVSFLALVLGHLSAAPTLPKLTTFTHTGHAISVFQKKEVVNVIIRGVNYT